LPARVVAFVRHTAREVVRGRSPRQLHHHRRSVLVVPLAGAGTVLVDRWMLPVEPGRALLIQPYQFHQYSGLPGGGLRWLFVTFAGVAPAPWDRWRERVVAVPPVVWSQMAEVLAELGRPQPEAAPAVFALAHALTLLAAAASRQGPDRLRGPGAPTRSLLHRVNRAIEAEPPEGRTVGAIALRLGWTGAHLRRVFRRETGLALGRYLLQRRMDWAVELLRQEQGLVTDAALAAGYASVFSFSRSFRRVFGVPPREWRDRHREGTG
jgi:AraC family transcriptional regulator